MGLEIVLFYPIKSLQESYECLNLFLPFRIDIENTENFLYKVNLPKATENFPDIKFNCVSHWKAITWSRETPTGPVQGFACNPVIETNTDPEASEKVSKEKWTGISTTG